MPLSTCLKCAPSWESAKRVRSPARCRYSHYFVSGKASVCEADRNNLGPLMNTLLCRFQSLNANLQVYCIVISHWLLLRRDISRVSIGNTCHFSTSVNGSLGAISISTDVYSQFTDFVMCNKIVLRFALILLSNLVSFQSNQLNGLITKVRILAWKVTNDPRGKQGELGKSCS